MSDDAPHKPQQPPPHDPQREGADPAAEGSPRAHYRRGNRFFDAQAFEHALAEWRQAARLWQPAAPAGPRRRRAWRGLQAALGLLATVALVYALVFTLFPRDRFELMLLAGTGGQERSWWERFLDTGRPGTGHPDRIDLREWWYRLKRGMGRRGDERTARPGGAGESIDERWSRLLRRYGRFGPLTQWRLDYPLVSGYGLSRAGDYAGAVQVLEEALEEAQDPRELADLHQALANAYYYQGYRLQPNGLAEYDLPLVRKAAEAYEQSLRYNDRPLSYGNLGWMYFLLGQYDRAVDYSLQALERDGSLDYVRLNLGLVHLVEGRIYEAFQRYVEVVRRNAEDDVYLGGITDLLEVRRDHPGRYPHADLMIGLLALKKGDLTRAQESLRRFLASPAATSRWRSVATELLRSMDTRELTR